MRLMILYNQFDVVKVPFPFSDKKMTKRRPALILSSSQYFTNTNHYLLSMITSASQSFWANDVEISNLEKSGLPSPSKIRFKIFSLDTSVIIGKIGSLDKKDESMVIEEIKSIFSFKHSLFL